MTAKTYTLTADEMRQVRRALRLASMYVAKMVADGCGKDCVRPPETALKAIDGAIVTVHNTALRRDRTE